METNIFLIIFSITGFSIIGLEIMRPFLIYDPRKDKNILALMFLSIFWSTLFYVVFMLSPTGLFPVLTYIGTGILCVYSIYKSLTL